MIAPDTRGSGHGVHADDGARRQGAPASPRDLGPARVCARSPCFPTRLRTSTGPEVVAPNHCEVRVWANSPGYRMRSFPLRSSLSLPSRTKAQIPLCLSIRGCSRRWTTEVPELSRYLANRS